MLEDDIIEVEEFVARCGNMHLPAFRRIKTVLEEAQKQSAPPTNNERVQYMRNKYLTFTECDDGHYVVMAGKQALGCIEPSGQIFTKRAIFQENIFDGAEWTSECLQQLAEKLVSLEGAVSPAASPNNERGEICQWKNVTHGKYITQCGYEYHLWHLYEENKSLEDTNMLYCTYCGRKISPVS